MKIGLVISQTLPIISGVAKIATRLEYGLKECGCEVNVFSASELPRVFWGEYRFVNSWPLYRKILEQGPFDIINIHGPVPTFSDILLALFNINKHRLWGAKIVYNHNYDIDISKTTSPLASMYNLLTRILAKQSDLVVTSSKAYNESFSNFIPIERRRVIPWGVDSNFLWPTIPQKSDNFTILFVGQLRPYKGVEILLKACAHLKDCKVIFAGDGYCLDKYTQLANLLNLPDVIFKGLVTDEELKNLYADSHVVVLPSVRRLEAFGLVLFEGMGAGCVPVASDLAGVSETVDRVGLTFRVGDAGSLAQKLSALKNDPILLNHLSNAAWAKAKNYSWEATYQNYLSTFSYLTT
jgi:rhamnosyl/mannosyltransferase